MRLWRFEPVLLVLLALLTVTAHAQKTDHYHLDETYSLESNGTLKLQSSDAEVNIIGSSRNNVHLVVNYTMEIVGFTLDEGDRFGMNIRQQDGELIIEEKERELPDATSAIGYTEVEYTITLEVPEEIHLNIAGDDDTYNISNVDRSIKLDADDAQTELRYCGGNDFRFDLDDAELQMIQGDGNLTLIMDDGDADISNGSFQRINVDIDDASVNLSTRLFDDGNYRFSMDDGRLDLSMLGGGGTFRIDYDNARINATDSYSLIEEGDTHRTYRLAGGDAEIVIQMDDGRLQLQTM